MLKGHVFSKQIFENPIFALWIDTLLGGEYGIGPYKEQMKVTKSGNTVTVSSGTASIKGRFVEEDSSTELTAGTDSAYCILTIEIDLDKVNTESELNQVSYKIIKGTSNYPSLTQTDIVKNNAGKYQFELARFKTGSSGITDFQDTRKFLDFDSIYTKIQTEYRAILEELEEELESAKDGSTYKLRGDFAVITDSITLAAGNGSSSWGIASKAINYPMGFSKDNSVCISIMFFRENSGIRGYSMGDWESDASISNHMIRGIYPYCIGLDESGIYLQVSNPATSTPEVFFKIVLMKI